MRSRIVGGIAFAMGILMTAVVLLGKQPLAWKPFLGGLMFIALGGYYLFSGRRGASLKEYLVEGKLSHAEGDAAGRADEVTQPVPVEPVEPEAVPISGVLWRFLGAYIGLLILVLIVFAMLDAKANTGVNTAALIGAVLWPCIAFGRKHGRYFTAAEKGRVVRGMIAIDFLLQMLAGLAGMAALGGGKPVPWGALLVAAIFVTALHALAIYFFVGQAGKMLAKEQAKRLARGAAVAGRTP
jgi:hypothetical protein